MNFIKAVSVFLLMLYQQKLCLGITDPFSLDVTLMTAGSMIDTLTKEIKNHQNEFLDKFNRDVIDSIGNVSKSLIDIAISLDYDGDETKLSRLFSEVHSIFLHALEVKASLTKPITQSKESHTWEHNSAILDHHFYEILRVLIDESATPHLTGNPRELKKENDTICKLGLSQMQFMNVLLNQVKIMTSQYVIAKNAIYDILLGQEGTQEERVNVKKLALNKYGDIVRQFKKTMVKASKDEYICGGKDSYSSNYEIRIANTYFSFENPKYWIEENRKEFQSKECMNLAKDDSDSFQGHLKCIEPCMDVGSSINISQCTPYGSKTNPAVICINPFYRHSDDRYQCISNNASITPFCEPPGFVRLQGDPSYTCDCEYNNYYIDLEPFEADNDKVIVAAQLHVSLKDDKKILGIQFEQAKLLANGVIDEATRKSSNTSKIGEGKMEQFSNRGLKSFLLDKFELRDGEVVTSLQFGKRSSHVTLKGKYRKFNLRTGKLLKSIKHAAPPLKREYNNPTLYGNDWTKNHEDTPHNLISEDGDSVFLSKTALHTDAGRHVVPLIELQKIKPRIATPLSGAGLYVKSIGIDSGNAGDSGGYLGLKLLSYNMASFIPNEPKIE